MHHALSIREVLDTVLAQCSRRTLAILARTSRHFHQPCIIQLWKHVTEDHLIHLETKFARPLVEVVLPNGQISAPHIWARVQSSCALIRTMSLRLQRVDHIAGPLFLRMAVLRPAGLLFPRLKSVYFRASHDEELSALMLLAGSPLEKIDIDLHLSSRVPYEEDGPDIEDLLAEEYERHVFFATLLYRLQPTAQTLREFTLCGLSGDRKSACYLDALASFVTNTPGLKKFGSDFYTLCPAVVRALAALPELEEWVIEHRTYREFFIEDPEANRDVPIALSMITDDSFPKLRALTFSGEPVMAPALLQSLPSTLDTVRFTFRTPTRLKADFFSQLAEAVHARSSPTSLHLELKIVQQHTRELDEADDEFETPPPFSFDLLSPLLLCTSVDFFHFSYAPSDSSLFDLQNAHLAAMADAWPRLKTLIIGWNRSSSQVAASGLVRKSQLTLAGVAALAARCADLSEIVLSEIDTKSVPPPAVPPAPQALSLRRMEFGDELVRNVDAVARFVRAAFPNVDLVDGFHNWTHARDHGTWSRVRDELRKLRGQRPVRRVLVRSRLTTYDMQHINDLDESRYEEITELVEVEE